MSEVAATRKKMAEDQAVLVRLLLSQDEPDERFEKRQIDLNSFILRKKRLKALRSAWPILNRSDLSEAMEAYLLKRPATPKYHHGLLDGRLFLRYLSDRGELGADLRHHLIEFDSRYRLVGRRLFPRAKVEQRIYERYLIWSRRKLR